LSSGSESESSERGRLVFDEPAPGVARSTISNPEKRGAIDHAILDSFAARMPELDARCVPVTGVDETFSAGYDISSLPEDLLASEAEKLIAHPFAAAIEAIASYPLPTVAALSGRRSAAGWNWRWPATCGLRHVGSRPGCHREARTRVFTHGDWQIHRGCRSCPDSGAVPRGSADRRGDAVIRAAGQLDENTERALIELHEACFASEDFREGVRAIAEKRAPRWRGR
jgi:enoyl-CoA hydratase/carnithine racemase